jgi:multicomponent Na+:H+ antiporter subunit B
MAKRFFSLLLVIAVAVAFFPLLGAIGERHEVSPLAEAYLTEGPAELGAANLVTAVIVTYRGLDTLGEVTVLFAASTGVSLVFASLGHRSRRARRADDEAHDTGAGAGEIPVGSHPRQKPSELVETGSGILIPLMVVFGVFIFTHGHLTPGGGFQGGVVVAAAVLLSFLAGTARELAHGIFSLLEMVSGAGYVAVGLLGLWLAAGFLDPRFLPTGSVGALFSAGAIPVIYALVGVKVGAELAGVVDAMRQQRSDAA